MSVFQRSGSGCYGVFLGVCNFRALLVGRRGSGVQACCGADLGSC